ncbi:MAG: hypothetical protein RBU30_23540 [Polyangia bacterium]|jgi:hypothetical protein|nr:hypothetical protein [Polyangia bacterium]
MAELDVGSLADRLGEDEIERALRKLRKHLGEPGFELPRGDASAAGTQHEGIDDVALSELMDRLDAEELGCDYFIPVDFAGKIELGDYSMGSLPALLELLEEMMDDLDIDDPDADQDDPDEDDFESDMELLQAQLRHIWKAFYQAAQSAMDANLTLSVVR